MPNSFTIRFEPGVAEQTEGHIKRIIGFVRSKYVCDLLDNVTLESNPRKPQKNQVVDTILREIGDSEDIFPFKTKGILIAASKYDELGKNRYGLIFNESEHDGEGLLDGGHNMLALGIYFLEQLENGTELTKKIRYWEDMKKVWESHRDEIRKNRDQFDFKLPVELLVPANFEEGEDNFNDALFNICAARNNNAQLSIIAKENKKGFFDLIRKLLRKEISDRVEWKTNEWNDKTKTSISPRDIIAFSWIPLMVLNENGYLPRDKNGNKKFVIAVQNIYSGKGKLAEEFDKLMGDEKVSKSYNGKYEWHNGSVASAFKISAKLPELYDHIFLNMPDAYNKAGGSFGKIDAVKYGREKNKRSRKFLSPYLQKESDYKVPDGYIPPILYGLRALMEVDDAGNIDWKTDPKIFLDKHLESLMETFGGLMRTVNFDPQKVGKNQVFYDVMLNYVNMLHNASQQ